MSELSDRLAKKYGAAAPEVAESVPGFAPPSSIGADLAERLRTKYGGELPAPPLAPTNQTLQPATGRELPLLTEEDRVPGENPFQRIWREIKNPTPGAVQRGAEQTLALPGQAVTAFRGLLKSDPTQVQLEEGVRIEEQERNQRLGEPTGETLETFGAELPGLLVGGAAGIAKRLPKTGLVTRAVGRGVMERSAEQFARSKGRYVAEELSSAIGATLGQELFQGTGGFGEAAGAVAGGLSAPRAVSGTINTTGRAVRSLPIPSAITGYNRRQVKSAQDVLGEVASDAPGSAMTVGQTPEDGTVFSSVGAPRVGDPGLQALEGALSQDEKFALILRQRQVGGTDRVAGEVRALGGTGAIPDAVRIAEAEQKRVAAFHNHLETQQRAKYQGDLNSAQAEAEQAIARAGIVKNSPVASQALQGALLEARESARKPISDALDALAVKAGSEKVLITPLYDSLGKLAEDVGWNKMLQFLPPRVAVRVESVIKLDKNGAPTAQLISWSELRGLEKQVGAALASETDDAARWELGEIARGIDQSFDQYGGQHVGELRELQGQWKAVKQVFDEGEMRSALQPNVRARDAAEDVAGHLWRSNRQEGSVMEAMRLRAAIARSPNLQSTTENAILAHVYDNVTDSGGNVVGKKLQDYLGRYSNAFEQFPELRATLAHPLKAQRALEELRASGAPDKLAMQRTALSEYVADPEKAIRGVVSRRDGKGLSELMTRVRGSDDALAGLRRQVFDEAIPMEAARTSAGIRASVKRNGGLLAQAFGSEHVENLLRKADELEKFENIAAPTPRTNISRAPSPYGTTTMSILMNRMGGVPWKAFREFRARESALGELNDAKVRQILMQMDTDPPLAKLMLSRATPPNSRALIRYLTSTGVLSASRNVTEPLVQPEPQEQEQP